MKDRYQVGESPTQSFVILCSGKKLRHREVGWGATGSERPARRITNLIRRDVFVEPPIQWRRLMEGKALGVESESPPDTSGKLIDVMVKAMPESITWLETGWSEGIYL